MQVTVQEKIIFLHNITDQNLIEDNDAHRNNGIGLFLI